MPPNLYLGSTGLSKSCYIAIVEEPTANVDYWLVGDNFLRGYYQTYDMTRQRVGLASSKYILSNSYILNNTVVYDTTKAGTTQNIGKLSVRFNSLNF
jgi:hypothetical protein